MFSTSNVSVFTLLNNFWSPIIFNTIDACHDPLAKHVKSRVNFIIAHLTFPNLFLLSLPTLYYYDGDFIFLRLRHPLKGRCMCVRQESRTRNKRTKNIQRIAQPCIVYKLDKYKSGFVMI